MALVSDYLDGTLGWRERRRLERHLAACDGCSAYLAQMRSVVAATGAVSPEDLDPSTVDGLVALFEKFHDDPDANDQTTPSSS